MEAERNEAAETLITFRITDLAEYHSGDTTNDFIYVFDAIVIRSESPGFQENEKIRAYYQKGRLGRELRGPKEMKSGDIITISAKAIGDISIESILIEINGSNISSQTTPAKRPLFHDDLNPINHQPTWKPA